ncbi:S8 family peptidase [Sphingomonas solaris]|uniref:S8 family peptidase n=1 Tax=Alterirhizorhabdus solaris TaxID=2529389 RepID=UPI001396A63F|nr:S8 family serine peptidase [Sphingomonas solaris]
MKKSKQARRVTLALLLTSALVGMAGTAQAKPVKSILAGVSTAPTEIDPLYRNINPFYRNIGAFWGTVNPFYRNIGAFWGDIDPFYRNIGAFWGDLNPLYRNIGAFNGQIVPDYRNIGAFWDEAGGLWTGIDSTWAAAGTFAANPTAYSSLAAQLNALSAKSETYWGASVTSQTGKSFAEGFANPLFAKYGINPNDPASLEKLPANERSHFFMDWYDGLMDFSGTDHADHWMKTVNWTPLLTQTQGAGKGVVIGLVDFHVAGDADLQSKTIYNGGNATYSNGHGAAVGSLIAAAHDGKGVMGIAPNATIAAYNPFDATGTADWPDIKAGIKAVGSRASVVNLSLGVPGSVLDAGWRGVFTDPGVKPLNSSTVYVIAAGNDGITQTQNVEFKDAFSTAFIVVGSVDPTGAISDFSNRPGKACLTDGGKCGDDTKLNGSGLLRNHFIVAPGELILVSDDKGGTTRLSGTSFAAPLVSGAIALLHDRWPWLKAQPMATAAIILNSAKDLGAPGTDDVYGVGLLDVEASQAPLNFATLKYYFVDGTTTKSVDVKTVRSTVNGTTTSTAINLSSGYLTVFEDLGGGVKRDYLIPLSSRLVGTQVNGEYFQGYVANRLVDWATSAPAAKLGFTQAPRLGFMGAPGYSWQVSMSSRLANTYAVRSGGARPKINSAMQFTSPQGGLSLTLGNGDGSIEVGRQAGFGLLSDYDPRSGGVNPLLGFASGGAHASAQIALAPDLKLSLGLTDRVGSRRADMNMLARGLDHSLATGLRPYRAEAQSMKFDYRVDRRLGVSAAVTQLAERNSLLGLRSIEADDFGNGTATRSITLAAHYALDHGLSFSASATGSQSRSRDQAALRIGSGGLIGSAFQVGVAKTSILADQDRLRLSVAQPLKIETGSIDFKSVAVVDRETGEIGVVTQKIGLAGAQRRFVAEAIYATPIFAGAAEISAFGRGELTGHEDAEADLPSYMLGARARLSF